MEGLRVPDYLWIILIDDRSESERVHHFTLTKYDPTLTNDDG